MELYVSASGEERRARTDQKVSTYTINSILLLLYFWFAKGATDLINLQFMMPEARSEADNWQNIVFNSSGRHH